MPPSVRRVCCLVSHPTHRACHPGLLWPRCAAGSDVCPRSVKELDPLTWMNRNQLIRLAYNWNKQEGENKKLLRMHFLELLQGQNLWRWVALLSEVPQFELTDWVHRQNLCGPQISHRMDCAAVGILYQRLNSPRKILVSTCFTQLKNNSASWAHRWLEPLPPGQLWRRRSCHLHPL